MQGLSRKYNYHDILVIAKGQYAQEESMANGASGLLFCDTDFIVSMIWCQDKFGKCHPWISDMIDRHPYDLYLLCNIDLPWEPDPLRENPHDRERLFRWYERELQERRLPYVVINGSGKERLDSAVQAIIHR